MISLNKATKKDFQKIKGVGAKTAQNIVEYREEKGYVSFEDLSNIKGVGKKTITLMEKEFFVETDVEEVIEEINEEIEEELLKEDNEEQQVKKTVLEKENKLEEKTPQLEEKTVVIEFEPEKHDVFVREEAHLVGDMNDWDPEDKSYPLNYEGDGTWSNVFDLEEGLKYKIMYDSSSWSEDKYVGNGYDNFEV